MTEGKQKTGVFEDSGDRAEVARVLAKVLEASSTELYIVDRTLKVLEANAGAAAALGWTRSELIGKHITDFVATLPETLMEQLAPILRRERDRAQLPGVHRRKDGSTYPADASLQVVEYRGQLTVLVLATDATLRRREEEDRLRAQKLESVGRLAGGVAHDFNNVLTALMGTLSLARLDVDPDSELAALLAEAASACDHAATLTKQLLTFARGGAPVRQARAVNSLLRETVELALHGSSAAATYGLQIGLWPVNIDEGQMAQAIHNLAQNAVQAMPAGGSVNVRAENVELARGSHPRLPAGRYVRLSILDSGHGIEAALLPKIFDPYFTTREGGRGLGLATAFSIVKKHGGVIDVDSTPGEGARFDILLPASSGAPTSLLLETELPSAPPARVLVMDDDESVLATLERMLRKLGHAVAGCRDGEAATRIHAAARSAGEGFDLVVLDLTVPGGWGGERALRGLVETDPGVRAIVCSGYSDDPILSEPERHGFAGRLAKPIQFGDLAREVARVLRKT